MPKRLLPLVPGDLVVEQVLPAPDHVTIVCRSCTPAPACPGCGQASSRLHSTYTRRLADLPWQGRRVVVEVRARRLRCGRPGCAHRIFAERLAGAAGVRAQRTARLGSLQHHIGLALGGKAGARLAERIGTPVSGATLLRLVRRAAPVTPAAVRVLGVDDWAWKRGKRYGTVLVDLERHAVIDLLPDRDADSLAAWLQAHPGVQVIARDRGASFADGGRRGAPDAVHVSDRWHLLENCSAAVLDAVKRQLPKVQAAARVMLATMTPVATAATVPAAAADPAVRPAMTQAQRLQWEGWQRRARVHGEVMRLHRQDTPIRHIARDLSVSRNLVRRWLRSEQPEIHRPRVHSLDPWREVLERRWAEGCRNGAQLWRELRLAGFGGGLRVVTEWATRQRLAAPAAEPMATAASARAPRPANYPARRVARMLTADLSSLAEPERAYVELLLAVSPALASVRDLALRFGALVRSRTDEALGPWLTEAANSELGSFAAGLRQDEAAVRAALTLPWSSGQVEGQVTRLKLVKRQGYGRAKLDLLKARMLQAA